MQNTELDAFTLKFEKMTYDEVSEVIENGGFPVRYPRWNWGMEYETLERPPSIPPLSPMDHKILQENSHEHKLRKSGNEVNHAAEHQEGNCENHH